MTEQEWKDRMELLDASCIATSCCRTISKINGYWVFIGLGINSDVGIITGTASKDCPCLPASPVLLYRWGSLSDLKSELGVGDVEKSILTTVLAHSVLDRVIAGTWDASRDSPCIF